MSTPEPLDDETERLALRAAIYLVQQKDLPEAEWAPRPEGVTGLHIAIARGRMTDRRASNAAAIAAHRKALSMKLPESDTPKRCACCGAVYGYGCTVGECALAPIDSDLQHDAARYVAEQARWLDEALTEPVIEVPRRRSFLGRLADLFRSNP